LYPLFKLLQEALTNLVIRTENINRVIYPIYKLMAQNDNLQLIQ